MADFASAGQTADSLILNEIERQDKMWGVANERADTSNGELLLASLAQAIAVGAKRDGMTDAFDSPPDVYPKDWSGFRDYGSEVSNLVVAAAFLRQEIKRLIASGADTTRTSRNPATQPFTGDQPTTILP